MSDRLIEGMTVSSFFNKRYFVIFCNLYFLTFAAQIKIMFLTCADAIH